MKWITFYTKGSIYKHESHRLRSSMRRLGLRLDAHAIKDRGSWQKNAQYKAEFIRDYIKHRTLPTVWIDCDAVMWQRPTLLERPPVESPDFMASWTGSGEQDRVNSAVTYWGPTQNARDIADRWVDRVKRKPRARFADQSPLHEVIMEAKKDIAAKIVTLPPTYSFIFDISRHVFKDIKPEDIIVEQFQASRVVRKRQAK